MILHHVAQRASRFVVTGPAFNAERFGGGDLEVIDVTRVPKRLEDRVGEAQYQDVLRGFFAEEVIDAVGLFFTERIADDAVEFARGFQIAAERFFDNDASPASFGLLVQSRTLQMFQDRFELIWSDREIKKPIAARAAFLVDLFQALGQTFEAGLVAEIALMIKN